MKQPIIDSTTLQAALVGYRTMIEHMNTEIGRIDDMLRPAPARRSMSAKGRQAIARGQRKRWAIYRAQNRRTAKGKIAA